MDYYAQKRKNIRFSAKSANNRLLAWSYKPPDSAQCPLFIQRVVSEGLKKEIAADTA
jgi:hypothetical protein